MKPAKRWAAVIGCLLWVISLSGCDLLPTADFDDYDVSGYIQALLDSSYRNSHEEFMVVAQTTLENAQVNNQTTVENAAVHFCNAYSLTPTPTEEQLATLRGIMGQLLLSAQYTVKEEQKVDTGYYIEVEVTPIRSLAGLGGELTNLRADALNEANAVNNPPSPTPTGEEEAGEDQEGGEDSWDWEEEEPTPEPSPTPAPTPEGKRVDSGKLYIDKVLELCQSKVGNVEYQAEPVTIALNIVQTSQGELQLDMNQIEQIDQTVLLFR